MVLEVAPEGQGGEGQGREGKGREGKEQGAGSWELVLVEDIRATIGVSPVCDCRSFLGWTANLFRGR